MPAITQKVSVRSKPITDARIQPAIDGVDHDDSGNHREASPDEDGERRQGAAHRHRGRAGGP